MDYLSKARQSSADASKALTPTSRPVSISIITATLNAERFLLDCIRSVRDQEGEGFTVQHVVVDGGSTDGTPEIGRSCGCVVVEGRDTGVYDALNKGVRAATGDLFTVLGADDTLAPGALGAVADWFRHRSSDWVVGVHHWINGVGQSIGLMRPPPRWIPPAVFASLGWSCLSSQATYMTREFFEHLGSYDTSYKIMADYKLFAEALDVQRFDRLNESLAFGRLHGRNVSAATGSRLYLDERARIENEYGPRSRLLRSAYRQALRVWLNGRNPGWFFGKRLHAPRDVLS